jgi:hypothetical protein
VHPQAELRGNVDSIGPRMRPDDGRVVSNFIVQALRGESLTLCWRSSAAGARSLDAAARRRRRGA